MAAHSAARSKHATKRRTAQKPQTQLCGFQTNKSEELLKFAIEPRILKRYGCPSTFLDETNKPEDTISSLCSGSITPNSMTPEINKRLLIQGADR